MLWTPEQIIKESLELLTARNELLEYLLWSKWQNRNWWQKLRDRILRRQPPPKPPEAKFTTIVPDWKFFQ